MIRNPEVQTEVSDIYHRFIAQDPDDIMALTTRLLDKAQGSSRTGVTYAFDYKAVGLDYPTSELTKHVEDSTGILKDAATNLYLAVARVSEPASEEVAGYAVKELKRFRPIGFGDLADRRIAQFAQIVGRSPSRLALVG